MRWFHCLLFLHMLLLTVSGQESVEFITLHDTTSDVFRGLSHSNDPVAFSLQHELLLNISRNVLAAENWVKTHVLSQYPSTNITTIVVGHTLLCDKEKDGNFNLILPSIKNIFYSLTRWGLQKEIKVSASFGESCLHSNSDIFRADLTETLVKPILNFLQETSSTYVINAPSENSEFLVYAHSNAMKKLGFLRTGKINVVVNRKLGEKPTSRKLSFIDNSDVVYPYPARPTPLRKTQEPSGSSNPAYAANTPLPPLVGSGVSPPPFARPFAPHLSPEAAAHPGTPHYGPHLLPCAPSPSPFPSPSDGGEVAKPPSVGGGRVHGGLWCVAKPSVPPETLQEALDFACGEGGADCEEIQPSGNCYFPDTTVAHASYAFNSYWQKTKSNGGICGFGGTAMLINSDPSKRIT
ncbi:hypothetical protein Leryth_007023 [Lithospermum erythrorhizon]|nr:hypothetical protein Leryth_007023 [Lithospermum erythrorhizon]